MRPLLLLIRYMSSHQIMSEPACKLAKMSELSVNNKTFKKIFDPSVTTFEQLVKMETFIDHTNFIRHVIEGPKVQCLTCQPWSCKSSNLEMVRSFLEIEVYKYGLNRGNSIRNITREAISIMDLKGENLKNYDLFCVPEPKCKILEDEEFVLKHFGRYPVIQLDCKIEIITSLNDALDQYLDIIHEAYLKHDYLICSMRLNAIEDLNRNAQNYCKRWCDLDTYKEGDIAIKMNNVRIGLINLVRFLHSHFGRKTVLLVDDFYLVDHKCDGPCSMFQIDDNENALITKIRNMYLEMVGCILKGQAFNDHVKCALLMAPKTMFKGEWPSQLTKVKHYSILDYKDLIEFHGVLETDMLALVAKLKSKGMFSHLEDTEMQHMMYTIRYYTINNKDASDQRTVISIFRTLRFLDEAISET